MTVELVRLHVGMGPPNRVLLKLAPHDDEDLSAVISATIKVRRPDGTEVEWDATMTNQTATTLWLIHVLAEDLSDLPVHGNYLLYPTLELATGELRTQGTFEMPVYTRFGRVIR